MKLLRGALPSPFVRLAGLRGDILKLAKKIEKMHEFGYIVNEMDKMDHFGKATELFPKIVAAIQLYKNKYVAQLTVTDLGWGLDTRNGGTLTTSVFAPSNASGVVVELLPALLPTILKHTNTSANAATVNQTQSSAQVAGCGSELGGHSACWTWGRAWPRRPRSSSSSSSSLLVLTSSKGKGKEGTKDLSLFLVSKDQFIANFLEKYEVDHSQLHNILKRRIFVME